MGKSLKVINCVFPSIILMFLSRIIQTQTMDRTLRTFVAMSERKASLGAEPFYS